MHPLIGENAGDPGGDRILGAPDEEVERHAESEDDCDNSRDHLPALVDREPAAGAGEGLQPDQRPGERDGDGGGDERVLERDDEAALAAALAGSEGRLAGNRGSALLVEDLGALGGILGSRLIAYFGRHFRLSLLRVCREARKA